MGWATKYLKGKDPTKDTVPVKNIKQLLALGDVIEVGVKKLDKETVHLRLEQTPLVEGALVAIDPKTGAIRAMVGGYDFARSEYNRAVLARRQPGSSFKPIIYATAMNQGMSPATVVLDAPVVYEQEEEDKTWKPENYGKRFHGIVSLREALIHSHNLATVRLLDKVGIRNVIDRLQQAPIHLVRELGDGGEPEHSALALVGMGSAKNAVQQVDVTRAL